MFEQDGENQNQDDGQMVNDHPATPATPNPVVQPSSDSAPVVPELSPSLTLDQLDAAVGDDSTAPTTAAKDDLLAIKQQALQRLTPLVGHLDQDPEEKFRTSMMMIQASDDDSLIKTAYETASQITDEKARAQALLDVINEINYFTQQKPAA